MQDGLNGNLQNLVNDIKSLNASAAQVGTTFNVTQIPLKSKLSRPKFKT
ncbi:hypothetical protein HAL07_06960 [Helicobacter ailurogastricus]|uniref:Uncharacterized protein n=1 Tax=Helicobacter ailurogastricus TaxID=1578720 RepID=A0A0K2Y5E9_9HELI|nr:hypothetical protein HAL07_06960 [Helicobacter ailurogastricus]